jgi:hypothetical protein
VAIIGLLFGLILWFIFFAVGHWAIMRPPLNWVVLAYTTILLILYCGFLREEYKIHAKIPKFKKAWLPAGIVYACPLLVLIWTIWEIVERL